jgi:hypothetical protein
MTTHVTTISASRSQRVAGRLGRLLLAMAIAVGAIAAVAAPAGAAECWLEDNGYAYVCSECRGTTVYATCFTLSYYTDGNIAVYIGIDIYMSQQEAQAILNYPGMWFDAWIFGDNPSYDNALVPVPVTGSSAWEGGLSAEFNTLVWWTQLDEDNSYFDNYDDLYGRIRLSIPGWGTPHPYYTSTLHGYY